MCSKPFGNHCLLVRFFLQMIMQWILSTIETVLFLSIWNDKHLLPKSQWAQQPNCCTWSCFWCSFVNHFCVCITTSQNTTLLQPHQINKCNQSASTHWQTQFLPQMAAWNISNLPFMDTMQITLCFFHCLAVQFEEMHCEAIMLFSDKWSLKCFVSKLLWKFLSSIKTSGSEEQTANRWCETTRERREFHRTQKTCKSSKMTHLAIQWMSWLFPMLWFVSCNCRTSSVIAD